MILDRVRMTNYLSHPDTDWRPDAQFVALVGPKGAGKSAILDGVAFALFDGARAKADALVRKGATAMSVVVDFRLGGQAYRVERGRDRGKPYLAALRRVGPDERNDWQTLADGSNIADVQQAVADLLRLDRATFGAAVLLSQGRVDAFARAGATERKAILAAILDLDIYPRARDEAKERLSAQQQVVDRLTGERDTLEREAARLADGAAQVEPATVELAAARSALEATQVRAQTAEAQADDLRQRLAGRPALEGQREGLRERYVATQTALGVVHAKREGVGTRLQAIAQDILRLTAANGGAGQAGDITAAAARFADLQARAQAADQATADLLAAQQARTAAFSRANEAWRNAQAAQRKAQSDVDARLSRIAALEAVDSVTCPDCGAQFQPDEVATALRNAQDDLVGAQGDLTIAMMAAAAAPEPALAPEVLDADQAIERAQEAVRAAGHDRAALEAARTALADAQRAAGAQEVLDRLAIEQATLSAQEDALGDEAADLDAQAFAVRQEAEPVTAALAALDAAAAELAQVEGSLRAIRGEAQQQAVVVAQADARLQSYIADEAALFTAQERLAALERERDAAVDQAIVLRRLVVAFGPGGIPARIIETVLGELEAQAQAILDDLWPGARLALEATRSTKDGAKTIEALDILVSDTEGQRDAALLSGGERTSVSLALSVGLSRLIARRTGAQVQTLAIDEPDGLDAVTRQAFGQTLRGLAYAGDLQRVVLVTHHPDLADVADVVFQVQRGPAGSVVAQEGTDA